MERKNGAGAVEVLEAEEVRSALSRKTQLTVEEERVVRMRYGVSTGLEEPVGTSSIDGDISDELALMELQLVKRWREHVAAESAKAARAAWLGNRGTSRTREKIVRALRRKR